MFKFAIAAAVVSMLAGSVMAQAAGPKGGQGGAKPGQGQGQGQRMGMGGGMMRGGKEMQEARAKVFKDLKLTADQMKKVEAADKKAADARQALMKDAMGNMKPGQQPTEAQRKAMMDKFQANRPKMEKIQADHNAALKAAMGADKFAQYEKAMKAARDKMRAAREKNGGGTGRPGGAAGAGVKKGGGGL